MSCICTAITVSDDSWTTTDVKDFKVYDKPAWKRTIVECALYDNVYQALVTLCDSICYQLLQFGTGVLFHTAADIATNLDRLLSASVGADFTFATFNSWNM